VKAIGQVSKDADQLRGEMLLAVVDRAAIADDVVASIRTEFQGQLRRQRRGHAVRGVEDDAVVLWADHEDSAGAGAGIFDQAADGLLQALLGVGRLGDDFADSMDDLLVVVRHRRMFPGGGVVVYCGSRIAPRPGSQAARGSQCSQKSATGDCKPDSVRRLAAP